MKELKELIRVLLAIFRYPVAIVIAFVASIATLCYLPNLFPPWTSNGDSSFWAIIWFFSTGMAGVATGSFCLPRGQRWIGALCLLFLGLGFSLYVFSSLSEGDSGIDFIPLISLGAGGIVPVIIHFLLRPKSEPGQIPMGALINPEQ